MSALTPIAPAPPIKTTTPPPLARPLSQRAIITPPKNSFQPPEPPRHRICLNARQGPRTRLRVADRATCMVPPARHNHPPYPLNPSIPTTHRHSPQAQPRYPAQTFNFLPI